MPKNVKPVLSVAILAGGQGTRLRSVVGSFPKVAVPVNGRPFVAYLLDFVADAGFDTCTLCTGYQSDTVRNLLGDSWRGLSLHYSVESFPLGTGGALRHALNVIPANRILAMNGDSFCRFSVDQFLAFHEQRQASISILATAVADTSRFGRLAIGKHGVVEGFVEKSATPGTGWINAGVYLIERHVLEALPENQAISWESTVLPSFVGAGLYAYCGGSDFIDIGTPSSYAQAATFFQT